MKIEDEEVRRADKDQESGGLSSKAKTGDEAGVNAAKENERAACQIEGETRDDKTRRDVWNGAGPHPSA